MTEWELKPELFQPYSAEGTSDPIAVHDSEAVHALREFFKDVFPLINRLLAVDMVVEYRSIAIGIADAIQGEAHNCCLRSLITWEEAEEMKKENA